DRGPDGASSGARARRFGQAHAGGNQRLGLLLASVPARDRVARGHEPRDNAGAHGAEPDETDVHAFTSQRAALSPLVPSPQPKSDISDFGRLKCRIRASPSSGGEGCSVLQYQGPGEGVRMRTIGNPLTPALSPNGERERTGFAARSPAI